nr:PREDICTED: putative sodium-dependent multivitamin transporter [Bemisia tabaci]XP_018902476.1 PREDICTED: putative sodium-dependent multivitamin transporter [Bemisia tabaci]
MTFFVALDYAVLGAVLCISAGIGIYYRFSGGKQKTNQEYLLGGRSQGIVPVAFSIMASFMSAITLLGTSAEIYSHGFIFVTINFTYIAAIPIITNFYMPVFFNLGYVSVYEYLEKRFGTATRLACSLVFILQGVLYMGVVLYAPALALEAVSGMSQSSAILIVGFVCIFYSTIGGIKAVIMTDVFQSLLMYAALFCVIGVSLVNAHGISDIWKVAEENGRINLLNFNLDPTERHSLFSIFIGGVFIFISLFGVNQIQVQRYLTTKDLGAASRSLWLALPLLSFLEVSACLCGLCLLYKYHDCDPIRTGRVKSNDQLMPLFVLDTMGRYPGLPGLFVAGMFSAALSTISGAINSLAAVTLEDYIRPLHSYLTSDTMEHRRSVLLSKILALAYGCICIGIAFLSKYLGSVLQAAFTIFGVVGGPLLAVFTLGVLAPLCNEKGALAGLFCGLIFSAWLGFGGPKPAVPNLPTSLDGCSHQQQLYFNGTTNFKSEEDSTEFSYLYRISYMYYVLLGFLTTFLVGIIVSCFTKRNNKLNPALYSPCLFKYMQKKYDAQLRLNPSGDQFKMMINSKPTSCSIEHET